MVFYREAIRFRTQRLEALIVFGKQATDTGPFGYKAKKHG